MSGADVDPFEADYDFDDDFDCNHNCDEDCYDEFDEYRCRHQHCWNCGGCRCPGYCDDYQTYNLRPDETGGEVSAGQQSLSTAAG